MSNYKIYLISAEINEKILYKIGYTRRDVQQRIRDFKTGNASNFDIHGVYPCSSYHVTLEKRLHTHFSAKRISGEWFELDIDDVYNFGNLCKKYWNDINLLATQNTYLLDKKVKIK